MSNLAGFLKPNVEQLENKKIVVSRRMKDENGNPYEWEFRPLSATEDDVIRRRYTQRVQVPGKKGRFTMDFDGNGYVLATVAARCVFPPLDSAELQNSYGVLGAENVLLAMLTDDEYNNLIAELKSDNDPESMDNLVDGAKN